MLKIKLKGMLILLHTSSLVCLIQSAAEDPVMSDVLLSTPELIRKYGYPVEEHTVQTEDGYVLTHFRIPHGRTNPTKNGRRSVLLQHSLLSASDIWILMGREKSLGFILADAGFDVWVTNIRGNRYSRKHVTLPTNTAEFWDFSWHEMAVYDMPATIDHILATTGEKRLHYIGYSLGTTVFFAMTSLRPEYNDKMRLGISLAPAVFLSNVRHPLIRAILPIMSLIGSVLMSLRMWEVLPYTNSLASLINNLCREGAVTHQLCVFIYYIAYGDDSQQLNKTMLPVYISHLLAGTSIKTLLHYAQIMKSGRFQQYDYGLIQNLVKYGQHFPPDYEVKKITTPASLHYGEGDLIVNPKDAKHLAEQLSHLVEITAVRAPKFNHIDFVFANQGKPLLYDHLLNLAEEY
ncbi:lipase 1-like [Periplaneta americana]|uniref:lipase 1-like n=1 Tax=Periplaneta americana TaxID=6978 RepID=UPI0037E7DC45